MHELECFEEPGNSLKLKISFLEPFKMFEIFDYEFQTWKIDWTHAYNFPNTQINVRLKTDKSTIPIHHKVSMSEGDRKIQTRAKAGSRGPLVLNRSESLKFCVLDRPILVRVCLDVDEDMYSLPITS